MKKDVSIVFQVNFTKFDDKSSGKTNRFFSLYRQLRRKRQLARFCREAFIEKAVRHLDGPQTSYQQFDSLIKSKGVPCIPDSIQQKEAQVAQVSGIPTEPTPELPATEEPEDSSTKKIDLEKLKSLL